MARQRAKHSGRKTFRPVFFALNKKCACRRIVKTHANFITNKENRLKFSRRFSYGGFAQVCKGLGLTLELSTPRRVSLAGQWYIARNKTTISGCRLRCVFLAGSTQVCNRKPPVQGLLALGSSFCGARENEVYEAIGPGPISPGQFFLRAPRYLAAARIL